MFRHVSPPVVVTQPASKPTDREVLVEVKGFLERLERYVGQGKPDREKVRKTIEGIVDVIESQLEPD